VLVASKRSIHQGAVFGRVPIGWLPPPLWVLRPKDRPFEDMRPCLADDAHDLFVGDRGEETVLVRSKARPVVVLSPHRELRNLRQVRVVPLYSYRSDSSLSRLRPAIEGGEIAGAFHLVGDAALDIDDGVLRLDQVQPVHAHFLTLQLASLTDAAVAGLLGQAGRYVQALDRRPVS
jgi:mRNA-degrading endonuclease toxin of MazEF toxin-antitoxin module